MSLNIPAKTLIAQLEKLSMRLSEIVKRDFVKLESYQLTWKKNELNWSICECIEHLNLLAEYYHPIIRKSLNSAKKQKLDKQSIFKHHWLYQKKIYQVKIGDNNKIHVLQESQSRFTPSVNSNYDNLNIISTFLEYQDNILQFLAEARNIQFHSTRVPLHLWGLFSVGLGDVLSYMIYHNERHIVQAQRMHYHDNFPYKKMA